MRDDVHRSSGFEQLLGFPAGGFHPDIHQLLQFHIEDIFFDVRFDGIGKSDEQYRQYESLHSGMHFIIKMFIAMVFDMFYQYSGLYSETSCCYVGKSRVFFHPNAVFDRRLG